MRSVTQLRILMATGLLFLGSACSRRDAHVLRIGVSPVPHGEILEQTVVPLRAQRVSIQIVNFKRRRAGRSGHPLRLPKVPARRHAQHRGCAHPHCASVAVSGNRLARKFDRR